MCLSRFPLEWNRRLVNIVCNAAGVWAVDEHGHIHFRHGHICSAHDYESNDASLLPPAWIRVPGELPRYRSFSQVYCGPVDWMVKNTHERREIESPPLLLGLRYGQQAGGVRSHGYRRQRSCGNVMETNRGYEGDSWQQTQRLLSNL